jgi:cysteine desulfuration protein SufE
MRKGSLQGAPFFVYFALSTLLSDSVGRVFVQSIQEKISNLTEEFSSLDSWEDRYKHLITLGKDKPEMDESLMVEANKVKGCQSQVWLFGELKGDRILFHAQSDAAIVNGIVGLLLRVYSESTVEEVITTPITFLEDLGLKEHLSMNRANGLVAMVKQIQFYGLAYKAKIDAGV